MITELFFKMCMIRIFLGVEEVYDKTMNAFYPPQPIIGKDFKLKGD